VQALTLAQRLEFAADGIKVVGVYPGPIQTDMTKDMELEKVPAKEVADALIKALKDGAEDVFPDSFAQQLYARFRDDNKAVERDMAKFQAQINQEAA